MGGTEYFSRGRCNVCFVWGIASLVLTIVVLVAEVVFLVTSGCDGQSGCSIIFGMTPLVVSGVLWPVGMMNLIFRVVSFSSSGKMVSRACMTRLRFGQRMMLSPLFGILVSLPLGLGVGLLMT